MFVVTLGLLLQLTQAPAPTADAAPPTASEATPAAPPGKVCRKGKTRTGSHMRAARCRTSGDWAEEKDQLDTRKSVTLQTVGSEFRGRKKGQ